MKKYRIHGDNIVECERIAKIIINTLTPEKVSCCLTSPSTISIEFSTVFMGNVITCRLELLPGFNKNTKKHWEENIFDTLKEAGSYFDETPDAIISAIEGENERILLGIEFCSALQAGNQAWQRSARAFSTGRTGCPYIYIVDFVKYELDNTSRNRKNLRFPNAAVPYSYVNYSKKTGNFVAQLYTKSEEFDKSKDISLTDFNEDDFGNTELGLYIVKLMFGINTTIEEKKILNKNMNVVQFLANHFDNITNFTANEWQDVYNLSSGDIVDYSVNNKRFGFHKTIAEKSHHGSSKEIIELVDQLGVGLASRDLPFGIIPANDRAEFAKNIALLYPDSDPSIIEAIGRRDKHLIIAIFKGFKPKGDDNRPDRGLLPLASMLSASDIDVLTYLYGPVIETNLHLLDNNPMELAKKNGLWRSILALSNFVILDVPVIARNNYDVERIYNMSEVKNHFSAIGNDNYINSKPVFSCIPTNFGEDDVDTGIHYLFAHILGSHCFEGMCNPPGGDWSGFSVIYDDYENRWLSLPRVSEVLSGKRPDHIIEMFGVFEKPLLLSIESKERSSDLEINVGTKLVTYIKELMDYVPSAKRKISPVSEEWHWGDTTVPFADFEVISAAAYLKRYAEISEVVFTKKCEILFVMNPITNDSAIKWEIEIIPSTTRANTLKSFIIEKYKDSKDSQIVFK